MGIAPYLVEAIIREHRFRPITGNVLLLGRQTFLVTAEQALSMLHSNGIEPAPVDIEVDETTRAGAHAGYIKDSSFFRLLGAKSVQAIDVTDYEGAEIIHDLNQPISPDLEGRFDFILDGSTLDNLFSPSIAIQSISRMLRSGGRFLSINWASAHASPYTMLTPHWFLDYFAINEFSDAKAYLAMHGYHGGAMMVLANRAGDSFGRALLPQQSTGVVVFAEKGPHSTWDKLPCQRNYASQEQLQIYADAEHGFSTTGRPDLLRPPAQMPFRFSIFRSIVEHYKTATSAKSYQVVGRDGERRPFPTPAIMKISNPLRRLFGV